MPVTDQEEHERIFGKTEIVSGRRDRIVTFEGETQLVSEMGDNYRSYFEHRRARTESTRVGIMSDISEAFATGYTEFGEVITSRQEKREFMKKHDLVEYEPSMADKPADSWVDKKSRRAEISDTMRELRHVDTESDAFQHIETNGKEDPRAEAVVDETNMTKV